MSLKSKLSSIITLAVSIVAFTTFASAQETTTPQDGVQKQERRAGGKHRGGRDGFRGMRGLRGIELTDAQKEQLKVIHETNKPDEATMQEKRTIRQAKRDGTITPEQTERLKAMKEQSRAKHEQVRLQIEAILTPEQKQQIEQQKEEWKKKREERRMLREQNKPATDKPAEN